MRPEQITLPLDQDHTPSALVADSLPEFAVALLAIGRIRGIGVKSLRALIDHYGDLTQVWTTTPSSLADVLQRAKVKDSAAIAKMLLTDQESLRAAAALELEQLAATGVQVIGRDDSTFPHRLNDIPDPPYWLFVEGNVQALHAPLIGIVGTRKPTAIGVRAAERLAAVICREGFGIVSGLAEGIDASAHRVGLYYRAPQVAVLGTGIDVVFPASTAGIRKWIIEAGGAVVSEYLPGDSSNRANFVQRNRIQAALALALVPVESQEQSGTAHTVRFAEQYHRPLFAVQRGQVAPQNDLVQRLATRGYPLFDLAQPQSVDELVTWLKTVVPPSLWPQQRRLFNARWFFQDLLRQLDDILGDLPVGPNDLQWLHEEIDERVQVMAVAQREQDSV